jgi:hypothetical protein
VRLLGHCSSNCISCETFSTGFSVRLVPFWCNAILRPHGTEADKWFY